MSRARQNRFYILLLSASLLLIPQVAQNAVTGTTMQPNTNAIDQMKTSLAVKESEIQTLNSRIGSQEHNARWWDSAYVRLAGLAIALGALTFFGQFVAHRKGIELRDNQSRRDSLVQQATDLRIAIGNAETASVSQRAGQLEVEAGKLKQKNLELEVVVSPRRLSSIQQKELSALGFAGRSVEVKSYTYDVDGAVLATQIISGLTAAKLHIRDNRLTEQPSGSVLFGVSVTGSDQNLVNALRRILAAFEGDNASIPMPNRGGTIVKNRFGGVGGPPTDAMIFVGAKPITK